MVSNAMSCWLVAEVAEADLLMTTNKTGNTPAHVERQAFFCEKGLALLTTDLIYKLDDPADFGKRFLEHQSNIMYCSDA